MIPSYNRQLCTAGSSCRTIRRPLHSPRAPLNIEHAQEPPSLGSSLNRRLFAVRITLGLARQALLGVGTPEVFACSRQRQCYTQGCRSSSRVLHLLGCASPGLIIHSALVVMELMSIFLGLSLRRPKVRTWC